MSRKKTKKKALFQMFFLIDQMHGLFEISEDLPINQCPHHHENESNCEFYL